MPSVKGKGGSTAHRYRPASEYDDTTLAQKREYWRNKKREQRARLTERTGKVIQDRRGVSKARHLTAPAASSSPFQNDLDKKVNVSGSKVGDGSLQATEKEKWLQTMELNKVSPQFLGSCRSRASVNSQTARVNSTMTSDSGAQINTSSSVPPVRVSGFTNSTSAISTPQPCVSMQSASAPNLQRKAQVPVCIQPKLPPTNVTTNMILVSSPCGPVSVKTEEPQIGTNSALVTNQRAKGVSLESEEERAAKRREQWRIKKREQRAKLAARIAKARERAQGMEVSTQTAQRSQHSEGMASHLLPHPSFTKRGGTNFATLNQQFNVRVQNQHGFKTAYTAIKPNTINERKPVEPLRRFSSHLSSVTRGITRCKTPRQRLIEAQKNFMNQRNIRVKSPSLAFIYSSRNIPRIDPNDTPEQIIAKRREYWRLKKREQRAKLSTEMKARLKEKDSMMRRVKRYQKILEEMRRARAMMQSGASTLSHASETIGGFIKEDGTVTSNIPLDHNRREEEVHGVSNNTPIDHPDIKHRGDVAIRVNPPPPPFHPAQVKVSLPLTGQSAHKPPRLVSIKPRTQVETASNSHSLSIRTVGSHLTLTHPQKPQNPGSRDPAMGSNLGGCVMKMAVSSRTLSLSTACMDPGLTEEERMAKKREYWRVKKREQRAARAARLKQGILQARANAVLQRRKVHRLASAAAVPPSRRSVNHTGNAQSLPDSREPDLPHANEIKQESESMPAVDLNSQPDQAICPDIKPPISQTPPPAPQPEPDPALNPDSQATTLLAVASMKKLLEESLSTVTGCQTEQTEFKIETSEEHDTGPDVPQICYEKHDADLTLQIKSWQEQTLVQESPPSLHLKDSPLTETPPPLPTPDTVTPLPTSDNPPQTPSPPSSPHRTHRLRSRKQGYQNHQNCSAPEPPKLHHLPTEAHQHPCEAGGQYRVVMEHSGMNSLQKKREYWKLMKRQQRARLKARQKNRLEGNLRGNVQSAGFGLSNSPKGASPAVKPALLPKPSISSVTAVTSIPSILVVSTTTSTAQQPDMLQVKLPVPSREQNVSFGPSQTDPVESPEIQTNWRVDQMLLVNNQQDTMPVSQNIDLAPSLPMLKPPENPLSSINLQPIEPPCQTSTLSPIKIPCVQTQNATQTLPSPTKHVPVSTMVPPKPIPGESEEDFLKRKREYWRIKKKEQRARKAIQVKGFTSKRTSDSWRPILPSQEEPAQETSQWSNSPEESENLINSSADTDTETGSCSYPNYAAPLEDESDLVFEYESHNGEEGPATDDVWRNHYLMDYDPLNQLLVCMVCGELQYQHSLEGVKVHIEDAHPDTLTLEPGERQRILEAWDEQVSQRERFFTSQLQQHSEALTEAQKD
ncbi:uncharacterized protein LOC115438416 isoform X2 [Sphaeramia orbicularis]|uniref:uncharacterized protein LOC115438416 isoform X2 n=1 Tax=Sphaeramia orbicularis TaxID=375764 RepID=UPI0011804DB6|nr:uncharacterized protein LOC115438416 isoform X2 [Sphaeramia orbicularis]